MAYAKCPECGYIVHYKAKRGTRIKDMTCERCDHVGLVRAGIDDWLQYKMASYPGPHYYDPRTGFYLRREVV